MPCLGTRALSFVTKPALCLALGGLVILARPGWGAPGPVQRYDFQPAEGAVAQGFVPVTPTDAYTAQLEVVDLGATNVPTRFYRVGSWP